MIRGAALACALALGCSAPAAPAVDAAAVRDPDCGTLRAGAAHKRTLGRGRRLTLGALADTHDAAPATLAAVRRFAGEFRRAPVDAVVLLGDLAASGEGVAAIVRAADAGAPLLVLPGEREPEGRFHDALDDARKSGLDVVDLQRERVLDGDGVDLVALPGYPFWSYLAQEGCRYRADDLPPLAALAAALDGPSLLLAHTPPRGARDRGFGDAPLGDPALARLLGDGKLRFALFAHVDEAAGADAPEDAPADRLLLNVGSADAVGNPPRAAIVQLEDGRARYRVIR